MSFLTKTFDEKDTCKVRAKTPIAVNPEIKKVVSQESLKLKSKVKTLKLKAVSVQSRSNSVSKEGCTGLVKAIKIKKPVEGAQSHRSVVTVNKVTARGTSKKKLPARAESVAKQPAVAVKKKKLINADAHLPYR